MTLTPFSKPLDKKKEGVVSVYGTTKATLEFCHFWLS